MTLRCILKQQRSVFPDGSSVRLDNVHATDLAGFAGVEGEVNFHTWRLLKGIALSTLFGVGTELSLGSGEGDLVRATGNPGSRTRPELATRSRSGISRSSRPSPSGPAGRCER